MEQTIIESNSIYRNEVLHGGELLKIRGLCRNKQAHSASSMNESSSSLHYASTEAACDKNIYEHTDRTGNSAIIKESPVVVVTSPQHLGGTHKTSSLSSASSSSSATTSGSGLCQTDPDLSKRVNTCVFHINKQKVQDNRLNANYFIHFFRIP